MKLIAGNRITNDPDLSTGVIYKIPALPKSTISHSINKMREVLRLVRPCNTGRILIKPMDKKSPANCFRGVKVNWSSDYIPNLHVVLRSGVVWTSC